jgi:hypothetical protein
MRLWTLHPRYPDAAGLVALWREGLLARGATRPDARLSPPSAAPLRKLRQRSPLLYRKWRRARSPEPHPLFRIVPGEVEAWERTRVAPQRRRVASRRRLQRRGNT